MAILDSLKNFSGKPTGTLSNLEQARLKELETIVSRGLDQWRSVATALHEIKEQKLYRDVAPTFRQYVETKWGMTASNAYKMMKADAAISEVAPGATLTFREAHAVSKMPPEQRQEAIEQTADRPARLAELEAMAPKRKRQQRKAPRDVHFKGKGWHIVLKRRRHDIDIEASLIAALQQIQQKAAA